eukprot:15454861-Alexandrium_andersonii.AAC.1
MESWPVLSATHACCVARSAVFPWSSTNRIRRAAALPMRSVRSAWTGPGAFPRHRRPLPSLSWPMRPGWPFLP